MKRWICGLVIGCSLAASGESFGLVDLTAGGRVVARYQSAATPLKPYVKELFTPSGVQVLLDSPSDHVHHHGLMFALGAGDVDFWSEKPAEKYGSQVPRAGESNGAPGAVRQILDWIAPAGVVLLTETRAVRGVESAAGGPNVLTWTSELSAPAGGPPVKLWGRHYFGLGLRFLPDLNEKVIFLHSDSTTAPAYYSDERVTPGRWCAARGEVGGQPVTVAMFDHPQNPRRPAGWFTMAKPFAYLSATLNLDQQPESLIAGAPLICRYGVALWDGKIEAAEIEKACASWIKAEPVSLER